MFTRRSQEHAHLTDHLSGTHCFNKFICWIILLFSIMPLTAFCLKLSYVFQNLFKYAIRVSNSLEPDQARPFVGPDLGPNCL